MTIDYSFPGKLILLTIDFIGKMIDDIPEYMKVESATTDAHHLFGIVEDATKLSQDNTELLYNFVAQLLYISKRARPDIQIAVSFLFNIVRGPGTDEYKNM